MSRKYRKDVSESREEIVIAWDRRLLNFIIVEKNLEIRTLRGIYGGVARYSLADTFYTGVPLSLIYDMIIIPRAIVAISRRS